MILDLVPYPETKDSGIEWWGNVPKHLDVKRIKTLLYEKDQGVVTSLGSYFRLHAHGA